LFNKITKEPIPLINEDYSYELKTLVYSMLEKDPNKRIKLKKLLYHHLIVDYYTLADSPTQFSKPIKLDIPHPLKKLEPVHFSSPIPREKRITRSERYFLEVIELGHIDSILNYAYKLFEDIYDENKKKFRKILSDGN
jgi:serine/threonine protein kinase